MSSPSRSPTLPQAAHLAREPATSPPVSPPAPGSSGNPAKWQSISAKVLGIHLDREETGPARLTRGESIISQVSDDGLRWAPPVDYGEADWHAGGGEGKPHNAAYLAQDPTVMDWVRSWRPRGSDIGDWAKSFFPFLSWIHRYNTVWLAGDLIAGITIGAVVVPQGMGYAKLADLPVEYGLYSSFVGVLIYWFFATSKDITIGPVAVMSTLVGTIIIEVQQKHPELAGPDIAGSLAIILGAIVFVLGFLRLGFIVDFIPLPAIAAFMTGSALNIAVGQVPNLMGIGGFNTRNSTYRVVIDILKHLGRTKLDAAMGLTSLFALYAIRSTCNYLARRNPRRERLFFFISTIRTVFIILLFTMVSWLVNRHRRHHPAFSILKTVPRGFQHMGVPKISTGMISAFATKLPAGTIVLLIEHIAISKSFGRVNNYTINPSQELIAIGITNLIGPFFGAYPATGSFSRTAIKSKAGVRTPFAGVITAVVVLLALYALPAVFFYISSANLSAVIIHAVGDLITSPNTLYSFWRVSPIEVLIFFVGVIVTVFSSIENGIYCTIAITGGVMLFKIAKANGDFVGRVRIRSLDGDDSRHVYVPFNKRDGSHPLVHVQSPHPGVFIFRFTESPRYCNIAHYTDAFVEHIFTVCRRTNTFSYPDLGSRPWNMPGPRHIDPKSVEADRRPTLKGIILDFSSVVDVDVTSVQNLVDVRKQLDRYASPDVVEWHFASIRSPWTRRALASVGFGRASGTPRPMFSVAQILEGQDPPTKEGDIEQTPTGYSGVRTVPISSVDRPWFHTDLDEAVRSVLANIGEETPPTSVKGRD